MLCNTTWKVINKFSLTFKDATSVSLYSYNRSQILEYVKYSKWYNSAKGIAKFVTNNVVLDEKEKLNNNTTKRQT